MKLGFFTAILPECSFDEVADFAAANQFFCIEVACWPSGKAERKFAGVTHIDVANLTQSQADDLNGICAQRRISISALGFYPNPLDPDPTVSKQAVDHFKKVVAAAQNLGFKKPITLLG